jgi:carbamoyl-phosphate synthase large subunit
MTRIRWRAAIAIVLCFAFVLVGFRLLNGPMRTLEISAVLLLVRAGAGQLTVLGGHMIQVLPQNHDGFRVLVTPFCSSIVPILALAGLSMFILGGPPARRLGAMAASAAAVVACNILRMAVSVMIGLHAGPSAMVLFHDWVGTLFALAYTVGGFLFMLFLLLPQTGRMSADPVGSAPSSPLAGSSPAAP